MVLERHRKSWSHPDEWPGADGWIGWLMLMMGWRMRGNLWNLEMQQEMSTCPRLENGWECLQKFQMMSMELVNFGYFNYGGSETCGVRMTLLNYEGITHISYTNQIMNLKKTQFLSWCRLQLGFTVQLVMCHLHRFEQRSAMAEQLFQFTSSQINPHSSDTGINIIEQQNHWNHWKVFSKLFKQPLAAPHRCPQTDSGPAALHRETSAHPADHWNHRKSIAIRSMYGLFTYI